MLTGPARTILDRWFESEQLKATLATDAIIGAFARPSMPGHRLRAVPPRHGRDQRQARRVGATSRGGMGGLTQALAQRGARTWASRSAPRPRSPASSSQRRRGHRRGPRERRRVPRPRSSPATPTPTSPSRSCSTRKALPADFRRGDRPHRLRQRLAQDQRGPVRAAELHRLPGHGAGPQHRGTIHICPDQDYIERAYDDAKYGRPSRATRSSSARCRRRSIPTVAPPGKHLMSMFIQYAPYKLQGGRPGTRSRTPFADRCFDILDEYAPNFKRR